MSERWRKPVIPLAVEADTQHVLIENGRRLEHFHVALRPEDIERIRQGYVCANVPCFEPHEKPFPEQCSVCGFPMAEKQLERLAKEFVGDEWVGPRMSVQDELAEMELEAQARKHRKGSQIVIPRGFQ